MAVATTAPETASFAPRAHPARGLIEAEIHARPVGPLEAPLRIRRAAFMADEGRGLFNRIGPELTARFGIDTHGDARQLSFAAGGRQVTAELHNEFATLTWASAHEDWTSWPDGIGLDLFAGMPLIAATRIDLMDVDQITPAALGGFDPISLCYSEVFGGRAEVATDFVLDADGFTRFEIAARGCGGLTQGVLVRRLLEIETYRTLALLGLPHARAIAPRTAEQEVRLSGLLGRLTESLSMDDNRKALDELHELSIQVGRSVEEISYRFAASRAYADVFRARIARLEERSIGESTTIARYLENRLEPALATCVAIEKRQLALTERLQRATGLLNARISLGIESQNQAVLDTISATSRSQYRLQQTVEGLSIIAISYYALALLGYVVSALGGSIHADHAVVLGIAAPFVVLVVWAALRQVRRRHK
jgi:uncharacterized membrane-anchored protein